MHLVERRNLVSVSRYHGNRLDSLPPDSSSSSPIVHPAVGQAGSSPLRVSTWAEGKRDEKGKGDKEERTMVVVPVEEERGGKRGRGNSTGRIDTMVQVKSRESGQFPWHRPGNPRRSFRPPTEFSPWVAWIEEGWSLPKGVARRGRVNAIKRRWRELLCVAGRDLWQWGRKGWRVSGRKATV